MICDILPCRPVVANLVKNKMFPLLMNLILPIIIRMGARDSICVQICRSLSGRY